MNGYCGWTAMAEDAQFSTYALTLHGDCIMASLPQLLILKNTSDMA
jgi:hypothetical protein